MSLSLAEPVWQVAPELALPMVNAQVEDPRFVAVTVVDPHATQPFLVYERKHEESEDELTLTDSRPIRRDGRGDCSPEDQHERPALAVPNRRSSCGR